MAQVEERRLIWDYLDRVQQPKATEEDHQRFLQLAQSSADKYAAYYLGWYYHHVKSDLTQTTTHSRQGLERDSSDSLTMYICLILRPASGQHLTVAEEILRCAWQLAWFDYDRVVYYLLDYFLRTEQGGEFRVLARRQLSRVSRWPDNNMMTQRLMGDYCCEKENMVRPARS